MPSPLGSCNSWCFPRTAAARSLPSSGSRCGRAATGRPELLRASRPRLSSPYANSLCKKPWAQPLPGVEHHQHAQGHGALASLSQPPPKDWHNFACRSPGCLQSKLCSCSLPNGCTQCLQDLARLLFICSLGHQFAAVAVFSPAIWGPWSQEDVWPILPSANAPSRHPK